MVVVPGDHRLEDTSTALVDDLEVRFLANRDPHLHFALLTDFPIRPSARRPETTRCWRRARRRSTPQRAPRRRPLLPVPSRAPLERRRAVLDGMGAQARQAARVQPAAARRDRYELRRAARRSRRCCRRSATSSRSIPTRSCRWRRARRLVGTLSHPLNRPRFDPGAARDRGLRRAPAAGRGERGQRQPHARFADLLRPRRHRSRTRPPSPTSTRTSSTRAATSARASTTSTRSRRRSTAASRRTRCSATTCSRASFARAGLCTDITSSTTTRRTICVRGAAAPLGPRRLADRALALAHGARRARPAVPNTLPAIARWKILDNLRRSLLPPALLALLRRGLDVLPGSPRALDHAGAAGARLPRLHAGRPVGDEPRRAACRCASTSAPSATASRTGLQASLSTVVPRASERGDARCDRPDAGADAGDAAPPARVGDGRSRGRTRRARRGVLPAMWVAPASPWRSRCSSRSSRRAGCCWPAPILALWLALAAARLRDRAAARAARHPPLDARRQRAALRRRSRGGRGGSSRSF